MYAKFIYNNQSNSEVVGLSGDVGWILTTATIHGGVWNAITIAEEINLIAMPLLLLYARDNTAQHMAGSV